MNTSKEIGPFRRMVSRSSSESAFTSYATCECMASSSFPFTVQVKLSPEEGGAITLSPVLVQQMPVRDLLKEILAVTGKEEERVAECLARGTLVTGGTRYRWTGWKVESHALQMALRQFPDAEENRPFLFPECVSVTVWSGNHSVEIPREQGALRRWLKRYSFWNLLSAVCAETSPAYSTFDYRREADRYELVLSSAIASRMQEGFALLPSRGFRRMLRSFAPSRAEFLVPR
jgi:hypothetical protein